MGRLWKLRDLQPCWRRYVIIRSGLWRFLAAAYSCSFSASVYNLNEISQVPAPACTLCLSSYYLAFYDCVKYHNQNQLGEKGLFHFIISGKSSWELKAEAEVLEECCLLACFLYHLRPPTQGWAPTPVGWTMAPNLCGMDQPTSIISRKCLTGKSNMYTFFLVYVPSSEITLACIKLT